MPDRRATPNPDSLFDDSAEGEIVDEEVIEEDVIAGADDEGTSAMTSVAVPAGLPFRAKLVVTNGNYAGRALHLGGGTAFIGRSSKCDLALKGSAGVSRRHCKVQLVEQEYVVIDLESRNGTLVNAASVTRHVLRDGDLLEVGDERVRFVSEPRDIDVSDQPTALLQALPAREAGTPARRSNVPRDAPVTQAKAAAPQPSFAPSTPMSPRAPAGPTRGGLAVEPTASMALGALQEPPPARRQPLPSSLPSSLASPKPSPKPSPLPSPPPLRPMDAEDRGAQAKGQGSGIGVMHGLALLAVVVVAVLGYAAWDIALGEPARERLADAKLKAAAAVATDDVDGPTPDGAAPPIPAEDPKAEAEAEAVVEPPVEKDPPAEPAEPAVNAPVLVRASASGRIDAVRVKIGDDVKKGQTWATLEPAAGIKKKLDALREEERAFAQAVKKGNDAAKADLAEIEREIADLSKRGRASPLTTSASGKVLKILVKPGDTIKGAQPVLELEP